MKTTIVEAGSPALLIDTENENDIIAALMYKAEHIRAITVPDVFRNAASFLMQAQLNENAKPVVHGKWIRDGIFVVCSACENCHRLEGTNFCHNCGAKMDVDLDYY